MTDKPKPVHVLETSFRVGTDTQNFYEVRLDGGHWVCKSITHPQTGRAVFVPNRTVGANPPYTGKDIMVGVLTLLVDAKEEADALRKEANEIEKKAKDRIEKIMGPDGSIGLNLTFGDKQALRVGLKKD